MKGQEELKLDISIMNKQSIVYDIVYNPLRTKLIYNAEELKFKTIDGLGMFIKSSSARI